MFYDSDCKEIRRKALEPIFNITKILEQTQLCVNTFLPLAAELRLQEKQEQIDRERKTQKRTEEQLLTLKASSDKNNLNQA